MSKKGSNPPPPIQPSQTGGINEGLNVNPAPPSNVRPPPPPPPPKKDG